MMRSPLHYSMGRGAHMDAADAELQTDVMRFMAILSLCLVAIFALVQSIPVIPKPAELPQPVELPRTALSRPAPEPMPRKVEPTETPTPAAELVSKPQEKTSVPEAIRPQVRAQNRAPSPVPEVRAAEPEPVDLPAAATESTVVPPVPPQEKGFTLQFEDDDALTRLISRDEVGFFAISAEKSLRLKIDGGRMAFWPSSTPGQYHEMDGQTVPAEVRRALLRSGAEIGGEQRWGVTLPAHTAAQLQQLLADANGGRLVIGRNGDLRLEQ